MNKFKFAILVNFVFIICQIKYFLSAVKNDSNMLFNIVFILSFMVYISALLVYIKYDNKIWDKLKMIQVIIVFLTMVDVTLISIGKNTILNVFGIMPIIILIISITGFYKTRNKVHISFVIWAAFLIIWGSNLYQIGI